MHWIKPEFEFVEICSEVTSYLYHRQSLGLLAWLPAPDWRWSLFQTVRVRVLGSAAGGGFPQWNCHCPTCQAGREGLRARRRTQSSLAIRGDEGPWFLVNASPDAGQQLETLTPPRAEGFRAPPIAGVLLTDAEIDHTAGLLLLRESTTPVHIHGSEGVERALRHGYPVLSILERYCGAEWHTLQLERSKPLEGSSLTVERFDVGGDPPRYLDGSGLELEASGLVFRDRMSGGTVSYVPGLARLDDGLTNRFADSDLVLVDGTFWRDDDLVRLGISARTARDMGHLPLSGPGGTLDALARLERPRKALVHINNTNPILLEDSAERKVVERAGVEVAYDGLEVEL